MSVTQLDMLPEAIATRVDASGGVESCWTWLGYTRPDGYGLTQVKGRAVRAHRWTYESLVGPIPVGLEIDHLCRNPSCVNPAHLEAVTHQENILRSSAPMALYARQTECINGHALVGDTVRVNDRGHRRCRECERARFSARRATSADGAALCAVCDRWFGTRSDGRLRFHGPLHDRCSGSLSLPGVEQ